MEENMKYGVNFNKTMEKEDVLTPNLPKLIQTLNKEIAYYSELLFLLEENISKFNNFYNEGDVSPKNGPTNGHILLIDEFDNIIQNFRNNNIRLDIYFNNMKKIM